MADLGIGQIDISLTGFTAQRGERIARLVAGGLASGARLATLPSSVSTLAIDLAGRPGESDEALAERIVADILRQLDRVA